MSSLKKLSLSSAILINVNIMIGTGLFINTTPLAKLAGPFGALSYVLVAFLLLPLVLCMAELLAVFPGGGFYHFAAPSLGSFAGFLSTWSYFFAKLGSATVGIHTFVMIVQQVFPFLNLLPAFVLDSGIFFLFGFLNMYKVQTGGYIQRYLIVSKIVPICAVILIGLFLLSSPVESFFVFSAGDFGSTVPLVLFSLLGFEAVCSLSRQIEHPEKNASYAVIISYVIVLVIYVIYQLLFYSSLGMQFLMINDFKDAFPALFLRLGLTEAVVHRLASVVYLLIGTSALSGAYGIFFANQWNLYSIAQQKLFFGYQQIDQLNKNEVPYMCITIEALICVVYLYITGGKQIVLQQLAALGTTVTYAFSVGAFLCTTKKHAFVYISYAGILSCLLLIAACIRNFFYNGLATLVLYMIIMTIGSLLFIIKIKSKKCTNK